MKGYYWLLIIYGIAIFGFGQNMVDGITNENTIYGFMGWIIIPTIIYLVIRRRKQNKLEK